MSDDELQWRRAQVARRDDAVNALLKRAMEAEAERDRLRAELAQVRSDHERMVAVHTDAYAEMSAANAKLAAEVEAAGIALAERDEVIADYSKVVGEVGERYDRADEKIAALKAEINHERAIFDDGIKRLRAELASMTAQRDSARDAHDAGKRHIAATQRVVDAAKAYSQVSYALEHFKGSTEELGALADAHSLARYAVRAAVDALAGQTSTGVGTSGAGSNESGRSVGASGESHLTSTDPPFADLDWFGDRGRGIAQLLANGGTVLAEFTAEQLTTFLEAGTDTAFFVAGECASCDGTRWVDDEGWQPEDYERARKPLRQPGSGRIPCGACNHGGWNVDDGAAAGAGQAGGEVVG